MTLGPTSVGGSFYVALNIHQSCLANNCWIIITPKALAFLQKHFDAGCDKLLDVISSYNEPEIGM